MEGTPIRKLGKQINKGKSATGEVILKTLKKVPNSNHITEISCKHFCGVLLVDGKYLHVKGYEKKIPLIWAFDEYSHDPIIHLLAPSENYEAYRASFLRLKSINYPLSILVCDENKACILAVRSVYPKVKIQICLNHYKEGIRRVLNVRTNDKHKRFMDDIVTLFDTKTLNRFTYRARRMTYRYGSNEIYQSIVSDINKKLSLLTTHYKTQCPKTTNMVECFNSHLEARLRSIKGFESFITAELWLNAYVMNRRLTKFTDCTKRYRYLNGQAPIQITAEWEERDIQLLKEVT